MRIIVSCGGRKFEVVDAKNLELPTNDQTKFKPVGT